MPDLDIPEQSAERIAVGNHPIVKFFKFDHLPPHLQAVSKPFGDLAMDLAMRLPKNAESAVALRKLLEAKDAAVRSTLP